MNMYDATEQAYKNGYEDGHRDAVNKIVSCHNSLVDDAIQIAKRLRNLECCERGFACNMMWDDVFGPTIIKAAEVLESLSSVCKSNDAMNANWQWEGHMR